MLAFGPRIAMVDTATLNRRATDAVSVGLGSPPAFPVRNQKSIGFSMLFPKTSCRAFWGPEANANGQSNSSRLWVMGPNTQIFVLKNKKSLRMSFFYWTFDMLPYAKKEFYVLGVGDSSHSRAALTPNTCHRQLCAIFVVLRPTPLKGPFESTVAPCRTYCSPFPETFLQKGYAPILPCMRTSLCKHKRPHSRQNIE